MRELNIEFQEQYKRLDKLCKEMYSASEGVSAYIQDMEKTPYRDQQSIYNWESVYKQLKHMRWLRNQLAHEVSIDAYLCEQSDIDWVKKFYESLYDGTDPLARAHKKQIQQTQQPTKRLSKEYVSANEREVETEKSPKEKPRKSLWSRIVSKIKEWFS